MKPATFFLVLAGLLLLVTIALAQTGYTLTWFVNEGGGMAAGSGGYTLSGVAGQVEAGTLTNGGYRLYGGFWGAGSEKYSTYLPLVVKN